MLSHSASCSWPIPTCPGGCGPVGPSTTGTCRRSMAAGPRVTRITRLWREFDVGRPRRMPRPDVAGLRESSGLALLDPTSEGDAMRIGKAIGAIGLFVLSLTGPVLAQGCGNSASGFDGWLAGFRTRAAAQGVSAAAISSGLAGVTYDPSVIHLDRSQRSFKLSFDEFYARRVSDSLIARGQRLMGTHRATLDRIERQFGVPGAVVVSIWGLETNYGADRTQGRSIIRSLATLAYDCRRAKFFENELVSAL